MIEIYLGLLGLCFGSFVGALTWRIHNKRNFVNERSVCEHCKHQLAAKDLIPLLSWLSLGGKCRYCHKSIGYQAPTLELGMAALFIGSYWFWPHQLSGAVAWLAFSTWLLVVVGLVSLFIYDLRWMLLPDKIVVPVAAIALVHNVLESQQLGIGLGQLVIDIVVALLLGSGVFWVLHQVSRGTWIGGGDVTLAALLAVLLGARDTAIALLFGFYSGALLILPLLAFKLVTRKTRIPFGPFLIAGAFIAQLFGQPIYDWVFHFVNYGI